MTLPSIRVDQYCAVLLLLGCTISIPTQAVAQEVLNIERSVYEPLPVMVAQSVPTIRPSSTFPPPLISARSAIVYDPINGSVLFDKESRTSLPQASVTKLMTALVVLDIYSLDEVVTISSGEETVTGNSMGLLKNEQITVSELMKGLLIYSGNDAATALANHHPEGFEGFVSEMNKKAVQLNLRNTAFQNPTGFDAPGHFSSSFDVAILMDQIARSQTLTQILQVSNTTATNIDGMITHPLYNTNQLIGKSDGLILGKTGSTLSAGECLVTTYDRDGKTLIIVVLGSQDRFTESSALVEWAYQNFVWVTPSNV